jgi:hypothetical protein
MPSRYYGSESQDGEAVEVQVISTAELFQPKAGDPLDFMYPVGRSVTHKPSGVRGMVSRVLTPEILILAMVDGTYRISHRNDVRP